MSFRKMKLVNDDQSTSLSNIYKHDIPVNTSRLSDLDQDVKSILDQNMSDSLKAKLYSQTLRRFLTFKKLKQDEDLAIQSKPFENLKSFFESQRLLKKEEKLAEQKAMRNRIAKRIKSHKQTKQVTPTSILSTPKKKSKPIKLSTLHSTPKKTKSKKALNRSLIENMLAKVSKASDRMLNQLQSSAIKSPENLTVENLVKDEDDWTSYD